MLQKLVGIPALRWILDQAFINEVLVEGRPAGLERRWVLLEDVHDDAMLRLVDVGRVSVSQLDGEDSEAPNIDLCVVAALALDQLGCHPAHRADFRGACISFHG